MARHQTVMPLARDSGPPDCAARLLFTPTRHRLATESADGPLGVRPRPGAPHRRSSASRRLTPHSPSSRPTVGGARRRSVRTSGWTTRRAIRQTMATRRPWRRSPCRPQASPRQSRTSRRDSSGCVAIRTESTGRWSAVSPNKQRDPKSDAAQFMSDAADSVRGAGADLRQVAGAGGAVAGLSNLRSSSLSCAIESWIRAAAEAVYAIEEPDASG